MTIRTIFSQMHQIKEKVTSAMVGGEFTEEEKQLLIDLAELQYRWSVGKKFIKENKTTEMVNSRNRVGTIIYPS